VRLRCSPWLGPQMAFASTGVPGSHRTVGPRQIIPLELAAQTAVKA